MRAPSDFWHFEKDISGCGIFGVIDKKRTLIPGSMAINAMCTMHDRGNGLGGGFAAYGIYPHLPDHYAFHLLCDDVHGLDKAEQTIKHYFDIKESEPIPTRQSPHIKNPPLVWRFFATPKEDRPEWQDLNEQDYVVNVIMYVNTRSHGAFIFSSGKNMGAFKGVGYPEDIADFYRLDEYNAYTWTGHNRFPTNTPGWWGGGASVYASGLGHCAQRRNFLLWHQQALPLRAQLRMHAYDRYGGGGLFAGSADP